MIAPKNGNLEIRNMEEQVLSILQIQELEKLGIDTNGGSMYWHNYNTNDDPWYELCSSADVGDITTFTLQDILEMLPKTIEAYKDGSKLPLMITITGSGKYAIVYDNPFCKNGKVGLTISESLLEAAFCMFKWCKQNNHL